MAADESLDVVSLRQLAVFVDSLDNATADQLLEHFPESQQRLIRDAVVALTDVAAAEREALAAAFRQFVQNGPPASQAPPSAPSLPDDPRAARTTTADPPTAAHQNEADALRRALQDVPVEALVEVLGQEAPPTLTLVLAALTPERAAQFLQRLDPQQQSELLQRLTRLSAADREILDILRQTVLDHWLRHRAASASHAAGRDVLQSILEAAPPPVQKRWHHIVANPQPPAASLSDQAGFSPRGPASPAWDADDPAAIAAAFEALAELDAGLLTDIFQQLPLDLAVLSLAGTSQACLADVLGRLPSSLSATLQRALRDIGPLRLGDIYQSQTAALRISARLQQQRGEAPGRRPALKIMA